MHTLKPALNDVICSVAHLGDLVGHSFECRIVWAVILIDLQVIFVECVPVKTWYESRCLFDDLET